MSVYILADDDKPGYFKIGRSTRTRERLLRDYLRGNPRIRVVEWRECDSVVVEREVLNKLQQYRVRNYRGRLSEWVNGINESVVRKTLYDTIGETCKTPPTATAPPSDLDRHIMRKIICGALQELDKSRPVIAPPVYMPAEPLADDAAEDDWVKISPAAAEAGPTSPVTALTKTFMEIIPGVIKNLWS